MLINDEEQVLVNVMHGSYAAFSSGSGFMFLFQADESLFALVRINGKEELSNEPSSVYSGYYDPCFLLEEMKSWFPPKYLLMLLAETLSM